MASKKNKYILADLEWAEKKLNEWKNYVDKTPFNKMEDRWGYKTTSNGGVTHIIVSTIEQQQKAYRDTMKDIMEILPRINELREQEEKTKAIQTRGDQDIPDIMKTDEN